MGSNICCQEVQNKNDPIKIVVDPRSQSELRGQHPVQQPVIYNGNHQSNIKIQPQVPISVPISVPVSAPVFEAVSTPNISQQIKENLYKYRPFSDRLNSQQPARRYKQLIYQGQIDLSGRPNGYGKLYYPNGNMLVGQFKDGSAIGPIYYFWPDGSHYQGKVQNNKGQDQNGQYQCPAYQYQGGIRNSQMDGKGILVAKNFRYEGLFQKGKKKQGKLIWKQSQSRTLPMSSSQVQYDADYQYQGKFDQKQQFTGSGVLKTPKGTYKGQFRDGMKNGRGVFEFSNGLKYEGEYVNDVKQGKGTIYSRTNTIAYDGQIKNGVPNGKGKVPGPTGSAIQSQWIEGLNANVLSDSQIKQRFGK